MNKCITKIEIIPNYDEDGHKDCTLRIEYSDGTGAADVIPTFAQSGVLEILRRASPIAMEALMASWMA